MLEFTDDFFDVSHGIVVVDFWYQQCPPCRALAPVFERVAAKNPDVKFAKCNVVENTKVGTFYGINAVPTIMFFKNGITVKKIMGLQSEAELNRMVAELR